MPAPKATIRDFLGTLDFLMFHCGSAQRSGDKAELLASLPYIQSELNRARASLERLNLFELVGRVLNQTETLVASDKIHDADRLVLSLAIVLGELSGENAVVRREFGPPPKDVRPQ